MIEKLFTAAMVATVLLTLYLGVDALILLDAGTVAQAIDGITLLK